MVLLQLKPDGLPRAGSSARPSQVPVHSAADSGARCAGGPHISFHTLVSRARPRAHARRRRRMQLLTDRRISLRTDLAIHPSRPPAVGPLRTILSTSNWRTPQWCGVGRALVRACFTGVQRAAAPCRNDTPHRTKPKRSMEKKGLTRGLRRRMFPVDDSAGSVWDAELNGLPFIYTKSRNYT